MDCLQTVCHSTHSKLALHDDGSSSCCYRPIPQERPQDLRRNHSTLCNKLFAMGALGVCRAEIDSAVPHPNSDSPPRLNTRSLPVPAAPNLTNGETCLFLVFSHCSALCNIGCVLTVMLWLSLDYWLVVWVPMQLLRSCTRCVAAGARERLACDRATCD